MTTTPQAALLSDDEIERHFENNKSVPGRELRRLIGRSIEAAILAKLQATQAEPVQAGELPDERAAFERAYARHATEAYSGKRTFTAAEIAELREGDEYGEHRKYLNNLWQGWQLRAALAQPQAQARGVDEREAPNRPNQGGLYTGGTIFVTRLMSWWNTSFQGVTFVFDESIRPENRDRIFNYCHLEHCKGLPDFVGQLSAGTFFDNSAGSTDCATLAAARAQQPEPIKDHQIAQAVNELRDIAIQYHATQQLRDRIAHVVVPLLKEAQQTEPASESDMAVYRGIADGYPGMAQQTEPLLCGMNLVVDPSIQAGHVVLHQDGKEVARIVNVDQQPEPSATLPWPCTCDERGAGAAGVTCGDCPRDYAKPQAMTDRELLEWAAKAAGVEGEYESWTYNGFNEGIRQILNGAKCLRPWNPLRHDDQAFRLAVKLKFGLIPWSESISATHAITNREYSEPCGSDPLAATRRAIVRAAAAIAQSQALDRMAENAQQIGLSYDTGDASDGCGEPVGMDEEDE